MTFSMKLGVNPIMIAIITRFALLAMLCLPCKLGLMSRQCGKKGDLDAKPSQEESCWKLELLARIPPLLAIVSQSSQDQSKRPGIVFAMM